VKYFFNYEYDWLFIEEIRDKLRFPQISPIGVVKRKYGKDGLIDIFGDNLMVVLDYVARLCKKFPGTTRVIIS